ncbi:tRNA (guanosine(46)-N7)-methyltransferase TrmB [Wenzhouxiangella sp. XN79A]|uniref:tRNA (guanosine(46)-N7)-methyltransferase TrmB n=1 Tax=Wenzhouxiangella sp. XN79A TaxID=2724193 RepID=UPI003217A0B0
MSEEQEQRRRVRSFVRRPGRLTPAQQRALEDLLPIYAVPDDADTLDELFERPAPLIVEIGCGNGEALCWMAAREPHANFVGIEVHEPGVGRLLRGLEAAGLGNVRVAMRDAVEVLQQQPEASIDMLRVYFPDPWPKKRHHKRRLVSPAFAALAARVLRPGGRLHLATDWVPYAEWMHDVLAEQPALENLGGPDVVKPDWRPETHFERRGLKRGHEVRDLLYRRRPDVECVGPPGC